MPKSPPLADALAFFVTIEITRQQIKQRILDGPRLPCMFADCAGRVMTCHAVFDVDATGMPTIEVYMDDGLCNRHGRLVAQLLVNSALAVDDFGWGSTTTEE